MMYADKMSHKGRPRRFREIGGLVLVSPRARRTPANRGAPASGEAKTIRKPWDHMEFAGVYMGFMIQ